MDKRHLLGALKVGGTKMVCATGYEDGTIVSRGEIPTTTPEETIPAISQWFVNTGVSAVGICTFGPAGVNPASPDYGKILRSPKQAWSGYDLYGTLHTAFGVPCGFDTDANAACLGETAHGASQGLKDALYLSIGSGVGAGALVDGQLLHGMLHPEAGHVLVSIDPRDTLESGSTCPFHKNCLEGLISVPAIEARWGATPAEIADDAQAMDLLSGYLAQALVDYMLCYSPKKIVVGGSVAQATPIVELARTKVEGFLNGYLVTPELEDFERYIVPSQLGADSEIVGALELSRAALIAYDRHIDL